MTNYNIYLAKENYENLSEILDGEKLTQRDVKNEVKSYTVDGFGERNILYIFTPNYHNTPSWLSDIRKVFSDVEEVRSKNVSGLLICQFSDRLFAITFGHAYHLISERKIVSDFGLKVALNSLSTEAVRATETTDLVRGMRSIDQAATSQTISSFGLIEAQQLVKRISGKASEEGTNSVSGAVALKVSIEGSINSLPERCKKYLALYERDDYKKTEFKFIDEFYEVRDATLIDELDQKLLEAIKDIDNSEFEIAIPMDRENTTYEYFFSIGGHGFNSQPDHFSDVSLELYRAVLGDKIAELQIAHILEHHKLKTIEDFGNKGEKSLSIKKSMIGSMVLNNELYTISDGVWYKIAKSIKTSAESVFDKLADQSPILQVWKTTCPIANAGQRSKKNKSNEYVEEGEFNRKYATDHGYLNLDAKLIQFGERRNRIEGCDLLDIEGKRLIHVKRSSRSATLSHFFNQGLVSGEALADPEYWALFCEVVHKNYPQIDTETLLQISPRKCPDSWTIEYHLADFPKKNGDFNIPLFSKRTFAEASRSLASMRYKVKLRFIKLNRPSANTIVSANMNQDEELIEK